MRKSYYGRARQWKLGLCVFAVFLGAVFLVSCMAGSGVLFAGSAMLPAADGLGAEPAERTLSTDGVLAGKLSETVQSAVGTSAALPLFSTPKRGAELYREALLLGMLEGNYSAYVGNRALIKRAEEAYPHTAFVILIPASDVEARCARCFGTGISHGDTGMFRYLDRVEMYTAAVYTPTSVPTVRVHTLEETAHTYRMTFSLLRGREESDIYIATFEKREEGTFVWYALGASAS